MIGALSSSAPLVQRVYQLLSDQQFHSGVRLAEACDVSRSASGRRSRACARSE
jgi:hypothetical protein